MATNKQRKPRVKGPVAASTAGAMATVMAPVPANDTEPKADPRGPFPIADAPKDRVFFAWHPWHRHWWPAERVFGHMNVDPTLVINMATGRLWNTEWWCEMPPDPPHTMPSSAEGPIHA